MKGYKKVTSGTVIPVPGNKKIEEFFGAVHTQTDLFSLARMSAPKGWTEPAQVPEFDELTLMLDGTLTAEIDGEEIELTAGETLWVERGTRVRYQNKSERSAEYWAICIPAFQIERAGRQE